MSTVRKMIPKTGKEVDVRRMTTPYGMEEFLNFLPRRWMEAFMEPFGGRRPAMWGDMEGMFEPMALHLDLIDRDSELVVRAELPGVKKEDLDISIAGDHLTIEATREFAEEKKAETLFRSELGHGKLVRTVFLPIEVDVQKVKAELKAGILEIVLPKIRAVTRHKVKVA